MRASRWIVAAMLLLCAQPALAQLSNDAENPDIVLPDPKAVARQAIPPTEAVAEQAVVSPATGSTHPREKSASPKSACDPANPCATDTAAH